MSLLPDPPTGISHASRGLVNVAGDPSIGSHQALAGGVSEFEVNLINSVNFDRHFYDFGEVTMPIDQIGAATS